MEEQLDKVILEVTREVFRTMAARDAERTPANEWSPDITAMVGLGGQRKAVVAVHFPLQTAHFVAGSILGETSVEMSIAELRDTAGEVANIIAGNINLWLRQQGVVCSLSVPTVVSGKKFEIEMMSHGTKSSLDFLTDGHPYRVEMVIGEA